MIGNAHIQPNSRAVDYQDWQQLAQENGSLRAIIAELLIKNQNLRWELLGQGLRAGSRSQALDCFRGNAVTQELSHRGHTVAGAEQGRHPCRNLVCVPRNGGVGGMRQGRIHFACRQIQPVPDFSLPGVSQSLNQTFTQP